jgi:Protein of unknown function (DUF3570)
MKKLCLVLVGIYLLMFSAFSQDGGSSDSAYKKRKLKFEEANLVSSYYRQDGSNAAVTGGIGSQKLSDISVSIDVKLSKYDKKFRKHNFTLDAGIDHYTSASSDKINPATLSSASYSDTRVYPSLGWSMENEKKGLTIGAGLYTSFEYDYYSTGANFFISKKTKKNGEFSAKLQAYIDQLSLIYPIELRTNTGGGGGGDDDDEGGSGGSAGRQTYNATLGWSQIINKNFQILLEAELVYQSGYLSLPFNRVYFEDNSVHIEKLPDSRFKIPLGIRANYFLGDRFIFRAWYRYYNDSWNINSHTMQLETAVKINPFLSVTPFYRFYSQSAADHFAPYKVHTAADQFYTSNYDLSKFNSNFYGAGIRAAPPGGIFHLRHLNAVELRYGHYQKNIDMNSDIISLHLKFK